MSSVHLDLVAAKLTTGWPVVVTGSEGAMGMDGGGAARQGGATSWCKSEPRGKVDQRPMVPVVWESLPLGMQHERACHQVVDHVTSEMIAGAVREVLLQGSGRGNERCRRKKGTQVV